LAVHELFLHSLPASSYFKIQHNTIFSLENYMYFLFSVIFLSYSLYFLSLETNVPEKSCYHAASLLT